MLHAGMGYNGSKWSLSLLWVDTELFMKGESSDYSYKITSGNYRLVYTRRFSLGQKVKKVLEPIPDILGK
jgi:hypothetical protein